MNLGYIDMEHTLDTAQKNNITLHYGCLSTRIFKHFKIKLGKGEPRDRGSCYDLTTFSRMHFVLVENSWKSQKDCTKEEKNNASTTKRVTKRVREEQGLVEEEPSKVSKTLLDELNREAEEFAKENN